MSWEPELEELKLRKKLALKMGGEENIARQHKRGKLTIRERIEGLADPGSFEEIGALAGSATYDDDNNLSSVLPANSVTGILKLDGRHVAIAGGDFTIRGGAADAAIGNKSRFTLNLALEWRIPYVRLLDATGGSVRTFEQIGRTYIPDNPGIPEATQMLQTAPVVSAVLGSVAGLPAVEACLAHFNLMVKDTSHVFVAGPPVVKAAFGQDIPKEELGNEQIQAYESGVISNVAENEEDAFWIIRRFLSYMPANVWEMPPRIEPNDVPDRREESLLSIIPRDRKKPYDPYVILNGALDKGSIFEISPFYGRSRITALARVNGYPVGAIINNPNFLGGSTDVTAGDKVIRFAEMCDLFHLPIVYFSDEPGFMIGLQGEKQGTVRAGARICCVLAATRVPWITFVTRQLYGVAGGLHVRRTGFFRRYAWPSVNWGSMHIEGGAMAAYRREIAGAPDPEAKRKEIEARLNAISSPFRTAEAFNIEDIIDPRDTRPLLCDFIESAQGILKTQLGPNTGLAYRP